MKTSEQIYILYKIWNISKNNIKLQLANADTVLGRKHVRVIIKKKNWNS